MFRTILHMYILIVLLFQTLLTFTLSDIKLDYTISKTFQEMSLSEVERTQKKVSS